MSVIAENRKARFDYEVLEKFTAGIVLSGQEVKSAKTGRMQLAGAYAVLRARLRSKGASSRQSGELWLLNSEIPPYQIKNAPKDYDSSKSRKLLVTQKELATLTGKLHEKGLALVPLNAHLLRGLIKIELALVRSRKKSDKRAHLKKQAVEREAGRRL